MRPTMDDLVVLFYNYAVILSAGYTVIQLDVDDRVPLLGVGLVLALFWTGYFRFSIRPRVVQRDEDESDGRRIGTADDPSTPVRCVRGRAASEYAGFYVRGTRRGRMEDGVKSVAKRPKRRSR